MPYSTAEVPPSEFAQATVAEMELITVAVIPDIIMSGLKVESSLYAVSDELVADTDRTLKW